MQRKLKEVLKREWCKGTYFTIMSNDNKGCINVVLHIKGTIMSEDAIYVSKRDKCTFFL